jgi:hypothetical protein
MSPLAELVESLLMHDFRAEIVERDNGSYGIALPIDGWYSSRRNDWGMDAESVLPYWQNIIDEIRAAVAAEKDGQR